MPSAPTTPRRASNNRRSAPPTSKASESKTLDPYDANPVRDRIRQWQEQQAALASPNSGVSDISHLSAEDDRVEPEPRKTPRASRGKEDTKTAESTPRRKSSRWVDPAQREWVREARSSSTPRKRVVSDEHWKKSRSPRDTKSGPSTAKKDVGQTEHPITMSAEQSAAYNERQARRMRRRELRQSSKLKEQQEEDYHHSNVKNAASENLSAANEHDTLNNIDYELARRLDGTTSPEQWEEREGDDTLRPEKDDGRHRRRSQYADALNRAPRSSQIGLGDASA